MRLVQSFNCGCSVCQPYVEGSANVLHFTPSENHFRSFYTNSMPNPFSNQKQLLQLRIKVANTFSDHYLLSFRTLSLNIPAFLLDLLMNFLLKGWLCADDTIISHILRSVILLVPWSYITQALKNKSKCYHLDTCLTELYIQCNCGSYIFSVCLHDPGKLRRTKAVYGVPGALC